MSEFARGASSSPSAQSIDSIVANVGRDALEFLSKAAEENEKDLKVFEETRISLKAAKEAFVPGSVKSQSDLDAAKAAAESALEKAKTSGSTLALAMDQVSATGIPRPDVIASLKLYYDNKENDRILRILKAAQTLDICFVIDATGSMHMDKVFKALQSKIMEILDTLGALNPYLKYQLGFVAYRDPEDANHLEYCEFTTDKTRFAQRIGNIACQGGGDQCEDVIGGLKKASEFNWTLANRLLFLCGDAPCHGRQYHNSCQDNHPNGLGVSSASVMRRLVEQKIQMFFWKINDSTNRMIGKLNEEAAATGLAFPADRTQEDFIQTSPIDITSADAIIRSVKETIAESLKHSLSKSTTMAKSAKPKRIENALRKLSSIPEEDSGSSSSIDATRRAMGGGKI